VETVIDKHAEDMHKAKEFSERIVAGLAEWAIFHRLSLLTGTSAQGELARNCSSGNEGVGSRP